MLFWLWRSTIDTINCGRVRSDFWPLSLTGQVLAKQGLNPMAMEIYLLVGLRPGAVVLICGFEKVERGAGDVSGPVIDFRVASVDAVPAEEFHSPRVASGRAFPAVPSST
jgi:hypothetical protein